MIVKAPLLTLLLASALTGCIQERVDVAALPSPRAQNSWVHDGAGVIGDRAADINRVADALEADTSAEVAVVTVPSIGDEVPREFATALFNAWGVGKKGKDNGVLIVHVLDQRRVEIETGYGVEGTLTDARAKRIIDEVTIPFFKAGSFADGHYETVRSVDHALRHNGSLGRLTDGWDRPPGVRKDEALGTATPLPTATRVAFNGPAEAYWTLGGLSVWVLLLLALGFFVDPYLVYRIYYWAGAADYAGAGFATYHIADATWPTTVAPFVLPVVSAAGVFGLRRLVKWWFQSRPRKCSACAKLVRKPLPEADDDKFLDKGQRAEEMVESINYDVWLCECGQHRVDRYRLWSSYKKCPSCSYRTSKTTSETISAATYTSSGQARVTTQCSNCSHHSVSYRTIPKLTRSSSSSSSGGSYGGGGGGGSFGGGSSGGGGAGGSY